MKIIENTINNNNLYNHLKTNKACGDMYPDIIAFFTINIFKN